jgi:membrane-associated phospholipid phosphatase
VAAGGLLLSAYSKQAIFLAINTHYSAFGDVLMYYVTWMGQAEVIIPCLSLLMIMPRFRNWWYFVTALLCNLVPFFVQHYIKGWLNHPRPQLVFCNTPGMHCLPHWPVLLHNSFPSGHSEGAFSFFCFLSLILTAHYRWAGALFFLLALAVGYSRIYLAAHFFDDVYIGSIIGMAGTTLVFSVMARYRDSFFKKKDTFAR